MSKQVQSQVETAFLLCKKNIALVIPCYQRPYVWPADDVTQLLDDIIAAKRANESHYYIGTVITSRLRKADNPDASTTYELIDGQQRMTTLMLLALAFSRHLPDCQLASLTVLGRQPRLSFAIRHEVQALLGAKAGLKSFTLPNKDTIKQMPYLAHLERAVSAATSHVATLAKSISRTELEAIANYLFTQVKWVNNSMPLGMDLNRLFATLNTSGVQLEQSDILKSKLLYKINRNKARYEAIWQACEKMDNYFERNVRQLFPDADWNALKYEELASFDHRLFPLRLKRRADTEGLSIADLAREKGHDDVEWETHQSAATNEDLDDKVYCRPIISFPLLLVHAFRIYRAQNDLDDIAPRVNSSRLNESFTDVLADLTEKQATGFIECLWKVRYQFDRWVVKWVERAEGDEPQLSLTNISRSRDSSSRSYRFNRYALETSNLSQLQSVRNFTGERSAQYWLTPFLGQLVEKRLQKREQVEILLEQIDNQLSLATTTQKEASFTLTTGDLTALKTIESVCQELNTENKGTGFEHYWFQKLEYLLWKHGERLGCFNMAKHGQYRIVSKNSVEHVHPQNEEYGQGLGYDHLNAFGNLVLLSPGENSSYSNQTVEKKQADFRSKPWYDSLKLAHIFYTKGTGPWGQSKIHNHQAVMLDLLSMHYNNQ